MWDSKDKVRINRKQAKRKYRITRTATRRQGLRSIKVGTERGRVISSGRRDTATA